MEPTNRNKELTVLIYTVAGYLTAPPPSVVGLPGVNTYVKWVGKVCACIVDALLFLIWLQKIWSSAFRTNRLHCHNRVNVFIEAHYRIIKSFEHRSNQKYYVLEPKKVLREGWWFDSLKMLANFLKRSQFSSISKESKHHTSYKLFIITQHQLVHSRLDLKV